MSARFPSWISKTAWQRFSAAERENAIAVLRVHSGGSGSVSSMAMMRGIPDKPAWIKGAPPASAYFDIILLEARMPSEDQARNQRVRPPSRARQELPPSVGPQVVLGLRCCVVCGRVEGL